MRVAISSELLDHLRALAAATPDVEVCGLMFGEAGSIQRLASTENVAADPARTFEIDPAALIAALRTERHGGERLLGYFHSHPTGCCRPSATDLAMATDDGKLWLIIGAGAVAGWRVVGGEAVPVALDICG